MLIRFLVLLLSLFSFSTTIIKAQCPAATPLSIPSIAVTESRCQASGTATVMVAGGTLPYTYQVISGPLVQPEQTNANFQSLSAGTYTMQVKDACNTIITQSFTITGNYQVPQVTVTSKAPTCTGGNDGRITVGVTRGRAPFSYALIAPSPVMVASQSSNQFTGLVAGDYTCRVTDSCGNFQTRTVTVTAGDMGEFFFGNAEMIYESCDSFKLAYYMVPATWLNYKAPYTVTIELPDGSTTTHTLPAGDGYSTIYDTFYFRYHHISGQSPALSLMATNACGYSTQFLISTDRLNLYPHQIHPSACSVSYDYRMDEADNDPNSNYFKLHCNTISYTLKDELGVVLATQINTSTFSGFPPNKWYTVVREDCCMKDSLDFFWEEIPPFKIDGYSLNPGYVNKEGATGLNIYYNKRGLVDLIVASGPPSITFANGSTHNYVYPDTVKNVAQFFYNVYVGYFTVGTYKIIMVNSCGQKDSIMVTVQPEDLRHSSFNASLVKGCVGGNKILVGASTNQNGTMVTGRYMINGNPSYGLQILDGNFKDSLISLSAGNYYFEYQYTFPYQSYFLAGMNNLPGDIIYDTVIIPPYTQPLFAATPAIATCGSNRSIALLPDTTRGVSPYTFQITGGQVTRPLQTSPVFDGLLQGTYTFLQADACGNSYSTNITIDTLAVPPVLLTGSSCNGATAQLSLPNIPYYNYVWHRPNGTTTASNVLSIDPVTIADTGWYQVALTSSTGTCIDTKQSNFHLSFCNILPLRLLQFKAQAQDKATFVSWQTADEINIGHFILEKSSNGIDYVAWKTQAAAGRSSNTYTAADISPLPGISYYRLKTVGTDGYTSYSNVQTVLHGNNNKIEAIPSMVGAEAAIMIYHPKAVPGAELVVVSMDGKALTRKKVSAGSFQTSLHTGGLATGVYTVTYVNNGTRVTTRVVKW